jgi:hypothetical protein
MRIGKFFGAGLWALLILIPRDGFAYSVQGPGATSCAEFAKMYRADPTQIEDVFFAGAQGFMSSMNLRVIAAEKSPRDLAGKADDQKRALRMFCANNPLKNYMDGVIEFYSTLPLYSVNAK